MASNNKIVMKESTRTELKKDINLEECSDEALLEYAKSSNKYSITYKENGEVKIKLVLLG